MTTPKRKRGRTAVGAAASEKRDVRMTHRLTTAEAETLERAAEALRRQTGEQHTVSSVLRDGGLEHARRVVGEEPAITFGEATYPRSGEHAYDPNKASRVWVVPRRKG